MSAPRPTSHGMIPRPRITWQNGKTAKYGTLMFITWWTEDPMDPMVYWTIYHAVMALQDPLYSFIHHHIVSLRIYHEIQNPLHFLHDLQPFKTQQDNDRWRWSCSWLHNIPDHKRRIFLIYSTRKIMWICHSIADMIIVLILKKKKELFQPNVRLIQLENGTDNCCHQYKQIRPWKVQCHIVLPPYGQPYIGSMRIDMKFFHVNKNALDLVNDNVVFVVIIQLWIYLIPSTIFNLSRFDNTMTDDDERCLTSQIFPTTRKGFSLFV